MYMIFQQIRVSRSVKLVLTNIFANNRKLCKFASNLKQGWGQVQYLYLVLVLKYIFIST